MKKIIAIVCTLAMICAFCGCGSSQGPEDTIKEFCNGMKTFDFKKMQGCVDGIFLSEEDVFGNDNATNAFLDSMKDYAKNINYSIGDVSINGESATVSVTFNYKDVSSVIATALGDYMSKGIAMVFSGGDTSDEAMKNLLVSCYNDALQSANVKTIEKTITYSLKKTDSDWKIIDVPDDTLYILTSNILKALEEWDDL